MTMNDPLADLVRRIEELESQLAFQDQLHENLNNTVARQDREILDLKRQFPVGRLVGDLSVENFFQVLLTTHKAGSEVAIRCVMVQSTQ